MFISSAAELDDREAPLRDFLVEQQGEWADLLAGAVERAKEESHFRSDVDPRQFVFELYGIILSFHYLHRLFRDGQAEPRARFAFEELLRRARPEGGEAGDEERR